MPALRDPPPSSSFFIFAVLGAAGMVGLRVALVPVALLLAGRAAAQSLPDCTRRCITVSATPGCDINHLACICSTRTMLTAIPACINKICGNGGGSEAAIDAFNTRCAALADPPSSSVPPPQSPAPSSPSSPQDPPSTRPPTPPSTTETSSTHSSTPEQTQSSGTAGPNSPGTSSPPPSLSSPSPDPTSPIGASSDNNQASSNGGGGPSSGGLIGAIVGGLLGGLLVVGIIGCFLWRRRRREDDQLQAYGVSSMSSTSGLSGMPVRPTSMHKHSDSLQGGAHLVPYQDASGPASVSESLAARPLVLDTQHSAYPRRKGDPPPPPSFRGPVSPETEAASSSVSSRSYRDEISPQSSAPSPMVFPAGLTPAQLDLVQTMINRGLQGTAVVDVIERMLAENSTPAPQYDDDTTSPVRT